MEVSARPAYKPYPGQWSDISALLGYMIMYAGIYIDMPA
jgi:hypothetical protein